MKVVFLYPSYREKIRIPDRVEFPPLGMLSVCAVLEDMGHELSVFPLNMDTEPSLLPEADIYAYGIRDYFKKPWQQLSQIWQKTSIDQKSLTLSRAGNVFERFSQLAGSGKQILFVCEYRLYWHILNILQCGKFEQLHRSYPFIFEDINFAVSTEDPYLLWVKSELDDYPLIVYHFYSKFFFRK